ncbi:hypothetical protein FQN57_003931 [Myotisia sp. PD_48]|nr:hypothetical protein FQN57_003931 [Myotisia sp. PD_48]
MKASNPVQLIDLPEDVLVLIFPHLDAQEFLALCSTNKHFHVVFLKNPEYWRNQTTKNFRIPVQPLLKADGPRWYWLYKHLRKNTRVYDWGQSRMHSSFPALEESLSGIGNIADIQCGGWCTSVLSSDGVIYLSGDIDQTGYGYLWATPGYNPLHFPGQPENGRATYSPRTAIKQYSSGRAHILGLSDDGTLWYWGNTVPAQSIEFKNVVTIRNPRNRLEPGAITKIVAGWVLSSAFIAGTGIVYWNRANFDPNGPNSLAVSCKVIANTSFRRSRNSQRHEDNPGAAQGEVRNFIVLEGYIVFVTDSDKVYAVLEGEETPVELPTFSAPGRVLLDIQGAFRKFAVFTSDGQVLMGDHELITAVFTIRRKKLQPPASAFIQPKMPPNLQNAGVISIAFGDHHFCVLHSNGKISSHGREPGGCGALGLGSNLARFGLRGIDTTEHDTKFFPFAEDELRYVWFEPEKYEWLRHLMSLTATNSAWLGHIQNDAEASKQYAACVERAGNCWDNFPDIKAEDPDGLGSYFALSVACAGWRSAALVLVNEDLAKKTAKKHIRSPNGSSSSTVYRWNSQRFPSSDFSAIDFDTWVYGLPPSTSE